MSGHLDVLAECADFTSQQIAYLAQYKASARKSYGSYKPVIVKPDGRTEICEQRRELRHKVWVDGRPDHKTAYVKNYRGAVFPSREEAVDCAKSCIAAFIADAEKRLEGFNARLAALANIGSAS